MTQTPYALPVPTAPLRAWTGLREALVALVVLDVLAAAAFAALAYAFWCFGGCDADGQQAQSVLGTTTVALLVAAPVAGVAVWRRVTAPRTVAVAVTVLGVLSALPLLGAVSALPSF